MYRVADEFDAEPFATLLEAQGQHVALVERIRAVESGESADGPSPELLAELMEDIEQFELRLAATGASLPEEGERSLAQSLLDFWALRKADLAAMQARLSPEGAKARSAAPVGRFLKPYDQSTGETLAARAEETFQALPDNAARDAAKAGFVSILRDGAGLAAASEVALRPFVAAGVLAEPSSNIKGPRYVLAHAALKDEWPRLREWQAEADRVQAELERLRNNAKAWEESGSAAELPRGEAVKAAAELSREDDTLRGYVEAAEARAKRERTIMFVVGGAFLAVILWALASTTAYLSEEPPPQVAPVPTKLDSFAKEAVEAEKRRPAELAIDTTGQDGQDTRSGSEGWLWLGSPDVPQVGTANGELLDPEKIAPGGEVRTLNNLKVREAPPENDGRNIAGERIGQVSGNVAVEIIERPKPVEVNGVKQYWAKVRVVPVVYFQLDTKSRFDLSALAKQLEGRGFAVPTPDRIPGLARGGNGTVIEIRYYYEQDAKAAAEVVAASTRALRESGYKGEVRSTPLVNSPLAERVKTGTIEAWIYAP